MKTLLFILKPLRSFLKGPIVKTLLYLVIIFTIFILLGKQIQKLIENPNLTVFILALSYLLLGVVHQWFLERKEHQFLKEIGFSKHFFEITLYSAVGLAIIAGLLHMITLQFNDLFFAFALCPLTFPFWIFLKAAIRSALTIPEGQAPGIEVKEVESSKALIQFTKSDSYIRWRFLNKEGFVPNSTDRLPTEPWGLSLKFNQAVANLPLIEVFKAYMLYYNFNHEPINPIDFQYYWTFYTKTWWGTKRYLKPESSLKDNLIRLSQVRKISDEGHEMTVRQVLIYAERSNPDQEVATTFATAYQSVKLLNWNTSLVLVILAFFLTASVIDKRINTKKVINSSQEEKTLPKQEQPNNRYNVEHNPKGKDTTPQKKKTAIIIVGRWKDNSTAWKKQESLKQKGYESFSKIEQGGLIQIGLYCPYTRRQEVDKLVNQLRKDKDYDKSTFVLDYDRNNSTFF